MQKIVLDACLLTCLFFDTTAKCQILEWHWYVWTGIALCFHWKFDSSTDVLLICLHLTEEPCEKNTLFQFNRSICFNLIAFTYWNSVEFELNQKEFKFVANLVQVPSKLSSQHFSHESNRCTNRHQTVDGLWWTSERHRFHYKINQFRKGTRFSIVYWWFGVIYCFQSTTFIRKLRLNRWILTLNSFGVRKSRSVNSKLSCWMILILMLFVWYSLWTKSMRTFRLPVIFPTTMTWAPKKKSN